MPNRNYAFTRPLIDTLANLGLRHACITPGSRNTPLALAVADHPLVRSWIHIDERSAGFFGLGMARATRTPVVLICTSGTAAAEYLPALAEAELGRVPLIVLTADRPPELRDSGASQTIHQEHMYGRAVKWAHDAAPPDPAADPTRYAARLATQAWTFTNEAPRGPVHLNLPFRDPLAPIQVDGEASRPGLRPVVHLGRLSADDGALLDVAGRLRGLRTLIVVGPIDEPGLSEAVIALADALDSPVIADALSGLRTGTHPLDRVIVTGDALARSGRLDTDLRPDAVIRFGAQPTSKALNGWMSERTDVEQIWVDDAGWRDATASATVIIRSHPEETARRLSDLVEPGPSGWPDRWADAEAAVLEAWRDLPFPSEPAVAAILAEALPDGSSLMVGSSMPIRDIDAFFGGQERSLRVLGNRGANGIDGLISTALGVAAVSGPTYVLTGDLSLVHDLTAVSAGVRLGLDLTIVLVDNGGGGIFHFLPQADFPEHFETHLATPHELDLPAIVTAMGANHTEATTVDELAEIVVVRPSGISVVTVRTDRTANRQLHHELFGRVQRS
ncbi:MAG: 2-succinyl-5-enolpyruvyl-6-hydroxy-3-cyclohexene-1-carboxylic-acid synthase [Acidimicrobiia bacterium]|nr:2-succinyl-5-enolpyruvyl-6-hydroxy-3-cyclohexene-1-carboxylic-acid synthase [Acidimicrobiia bacterium]